MTLQSETTDALPITWHAARMVSMQQLLGMLLACSTVYCNLLTCLLGMQSLGSERQILECSNLF